MSADGEDWGDGEVQVSVEFQSFGVETYDGDIEDEALGDATASRGWDEVDEDE